MTQVQTTSAGGRVTLSIEERILRKRARQKKYIERRKKRLAAEAAASERPASEAEPSVMNAKPKRRLSSAERASLVERAALARAAKARYAEERKKAERRAAKAAKKNGHALVPQAAEPIGEMQAIAEGRAVQRIRIPLDASDYAPAASFIERHDPTDADIEKLGKLIAAVYRHL